MRAHERKRLPKLGAMLVGCAVLSSLLALLVISLGGETITGHLSDARAARSVDDRTAELAALKAAAAADPLHIDPLIRVAQIARDEGRFADAAKQWREIVRLDPLNVAARFEQVRNLFAQADYRSVIQLAKHSVVSQNPDTQAILAAALIATGQPSEADEVLGRIIASDPAHPQTRLLLANRLFMEGRVEAAEFAYRELQEIPTTRDSAFIGLVQIDLFRGDKQAAANRLRKQPPAPSAGYQVLKARADLWRQLGELDHAMEVYRNMVPKYGPIPEVVVPLAEITASRGDSVQIAALRAQLAVGSASALAAHHYLQAIEAYLLQDSKAVLAKLTWSETYYGAREVFRWIQLDAASREGDIAKTKASATAMAQMNLTMLRRRHAADLLLARATEWIDRNSVTKAEQLVGLVPLLVPEHRAAGLVLARAALVDRRPLEAEQRARTVLNDDDLRSSALEILGRAAMDQGKMEQAERHLRDMVSLLPEASTGHYWLGVNLFRQESYTAAVGSLQVAYQINPEPRIAAALLDALLVTRQWKQANTLADAQLDSPDAAGRAIGWGFKAGIHRALGDQQAAIDAYRQARQEQPERAAYTLALTDLMIDAGQFAEAEQVLAELAMRNPASRIVRFKQGYVAHKAGKSVTAMQRYRQLLDTEPDWALVLVNLSELLSGSDDTREEALKMARRAVRLSPNWDRAHLNLAQCAIAAGHPILARQALQRVLALSPGDAEALAITEQLGG